MSAKESCNNCMWDKGKATLLHCMDVRNQGDQLCERFHSHITVDLHFCGHCKREKDPGVCWWCGLTDVQENQVDEYRCIECGEPCDIDGLCGYCQSEYAGYYDYGDDIAFVDLIGNFANNQRNFPCSNCGASDKLTSEGKVQDYQCDSCAALAECGWD